MEKQSGKILVIDDEDHFRIALAKVIQRQGYETVQFPSAIAALEYLDKGGESANTDITVVDMKMEGMDGNEFITILNERYPEIVPIMVTAYSSIDTAVNSIKQGAFDFISKPFSPDQILYAIQKAMTRRTLLVQNKKLKEDAEHSLKILGQETSKLHTVVECMANPLIVLNRNLEIVLFNPFFENISETAGLKLFTKITDYNSELMNHLNVLVTEITAKKSLTMINKEIKIGGNFYQATCAAVITDMTPEGFCIVLDDITRLKEIESAKNQFVSMVAHEIKAPISATLGYIYLILDGYVTDREKVMDKLRRCKERSETLLEMVNDLLQISRAQTGRLNLEITLVNLRERVESSLEFYSQEFEKKKLKLIKNYPDKDFEILADGKALEIILNNLLSNAIKYTNEGGEVAVSIYAEGNHGVIKVKDTGIGMKKEDLDRLFTEFFRVKSKETSKIQGTGLGLSVLKKLVIAQKGSVNVESQYQQGSVFTVKLPLCGSQAFIGDDNNDKRNKN